MITGSPVGDVTDSRSAEHAAIKRITIGGVAIGATLSDGTRRFTATGGQALLDVSGWASGVPTATTIGVKNSSLPAQAKNAGGVSSRTATETVVVKPLAPILAPLAAAARRGRSRCWGST